MSVQANKNLGKTVLTTTIKRGNLGPVWDRPVPDRWMFFCPNFLSFCWSSLVAFGEFTFQKLVTNQLFGLEFCAVRQDTFYPRQDYEQSKLYIKIESLFHWLVLQKMENRSLFTIGWKLEHFNQGLTKFTFFISILNLFTMLCKRKLKIWSLCVE